MSQPSPSPHHHKSSPAPPSVPKKVQPLPWSHIETVNLIQAYQDKWYSLKRGQLKASQWEEVALSVAARCGFKDLSKSATQCRHKMEKLRKRYRAERQRGCPSVWTYFDMMDSMERGPFPISTARPPLPTPPRGGPQYYRPPQSLNSSEDDDEEDGNDNDNDNDNDEDDDDEEEDGSSKSRSMSHILRGAPNHAPRGPPVASPIFDAIPLVSKYGAGGSGGEGIPSFMRNSMLRKRKKEYEAEEEEDEEEEEEEGGRLLSELASVVRAFGEGFVRVENMKLEMMKETERHRLEMEKKRMEMIQESQRRIVDAISNSFNSHNSNNTQEMLADR